MAYNEFAYFYDELNSEADYDALYRYVTDELAAHGICAVIPGSFPARLPVWKAKPASVKPLISWTTRGNG